MPDNPILEMIRSPSPVFEIRTGRDTASLLIVFIPNSKEDPLTESAGETPVPVKLIVCGLLFALCVTTRLAFRAPFAVGENVTSNVTAKLGGTEIGKCARVVTVYSEA